MRLPRVSPTAYARITLAALVALVVIVITGAAVRLTGSGLGCPDWPTCENDRVVAPLQFHPMVEFVNRVFTGLVSVAVIVAVLGALARVPRRRDLTLLALSLVFGVLGEAVVGGLSVKYGLWPGWVMAHFLLSLLLLWAAIVLNHRAGQPDAKPHATVSSDYIWLGRAIFVMSTVVMFIGTMVTGSGPHGGDDKAVRLGFHPHDITKVHGSAVWILIALVAFTVWRLRSIHASETLVHKGEVVMGALLAQGAIGYLQYSLNVPAGLVLLHVAGACAVWVAVIRFNLALYERWEPVDLPAYDGAATNLPVIGEILGGAPSTRTSGAEIDT